MKNRLIILLAILPLAGFTQEEPASSKPWILSDKVIEFFVPVFLIVMVLQTLVSILKIRSNHKLRQQVLDKEISDEHIRRMINDANRLSRVEPLKWVFLTGGLAIAFVSIAMLSPGSDLISIAILFALMSVSFLGYYFVLKKK